MDGVRSAASLAIDVGQLVGPLTAKVAFADFRELVVVSIAAPLTDAGSIYRFDFFHVAAMHLLGHSVAPPSHDRIDGGTHPTGELRAFVDSPLLRDTMANVDWEEWGDRATRNPVHYTVGVINRFDLHVVAQGCVVSPLGSDKLDTTPALPTRGPKVPIFDIRTSGAR